MSYKADHSVGGIGGRSSSAAGQQGGGLGGMGGSNNGNSGLGARRSANPTPSYDMSLHNMVQAGMMAAGPLSGLARSIAGYGPSFQGYHGMVQGAGDYDPKNMAMQVGPGMGMTAAGYAAQQHPQHPHPQGLLSKPPAQPAQPQGLQAMTAPGGFLGQQVPGLAPYGQQFNAYKYFR